VTPIELYKIIGIAALGLDPDQFPANSTKHARVVPFWVKMASLALAIIFTFTVFRREVQTDAASSDGRRS
jgi:hypothetical protein